MRPKQFRSRWYVCAKCAAMLHRHLHCLQTERSEIPHDPRHLGVPSGASKMIYEPMVRSTQTVQLSCIKISTVSKWREIPHDQRHLGVPLGASKMISELMVRSAQTVDLSCVKISTISKQTKMTFHLSLVT